MTNRAPYILIVEDDNVLGGAIEQRLKLEGFDVLWVETCSAALAAMKRCRPIFVLSDIVLPDGSGEMLYQKAQPYLGNTPILFATAFGEIDQAVRLVKAGADDYLTKPYDTDELVERIRNRIRSENQNPRDAFSVKFPISSATDVVSEQLRRVANTDLPVLITGETGTGKEVAARYLHAHSPRSAKSFLVVNCGTTQHELLERQFFGYEAGAFIDADQRQAGYFEEVQDGTLFLDEIGELNSKLQAALLRVLHDGCFRPFGLSHELRFSGRLVAATNADLNRRRAEKSFRDDLYYRLSVVEIHIPPLRERLAEIEPLSNRFLHEISRRYGKSMPTLSQEAMTALLQHSWPGNIRELRNRLERAGALALGDTYGPSDIFPERLLGDVPPQTFVDARKKAELDQIEQALTLSHGRVGEAAKRLGISRTTLWKRKSKLDSR